MGPCWEEQNKLPATPAIEKGPSATRHSTGPDPSARRFSEYIR
jgi:hypothetical protein